MTSCPRRGFFFISDFASAAPFFQERGIGLINASPAGMGLLTAHPPSWHPAPSVVKRDIRRPMEYAEQRGVSLGKAANL